MPTTARPSRRPRWGTDTNFASGDLVGSPLKVQPTAGQEAQGIIAGAGIMSAHLNEQLYQITQWLAWLEDEVNGDIFGDGSDGVATISGGTTTVTDTRFYDTLTIAGTGILSMRDGDAPLLFVRGTLTIDVGGVLHCDGGDAVTTTPGGILGCCALGGSPGSNGESMAPGLGGAGGGAGNEGGGGASGGNGGTITAPTVAQGGAIARRSVALAPGWTTTGLRLRGGGGGGGGGGAGGGAGGGGGGALIVVAREIVNNGTIRANGGNGAAGSAGNGGGGGGGGGGLLYLVTRRGISGSGVTAVAAGAGAAGIGSGFAGVAGSAGLVVTRQA